MKDSIILILQDNTEEGSGDGYTMQDFYHKFTGQPCETPFAFHMSQKLLVWDLFCSIVLFEVGRQLPKGSSGVSGKTESSRGPWLG